MILVIGGSGHYGSEIVRALIDAGKSVRVLTRDASKMKYSGAEVREGDLANLNDFSELLADIDSVIISLSAFKLSSMERLIDTEYHAVIRLLRACKESGINRVVYVSVYKVPVYKGKLQRDPNIVKAAVEQYLSDSAMNYTILAAPASMKTFTGMYVKGRMYIPGHKLPAIPCIAASDMGAIAAAVIMRDDLSGRRLKISAAEPCSFEGAAANLAEWSKQPVKKIIIPRGLLQLIYGLLWPAALFSSKAAYIRKVLQYSNLKKRFNYAVSTETQSNALEIKRITGIKQMNFREYLRRYPLNMPE